MKLSKGKIILLSVTGVILISVLITFFSLKASLGAKDSDENAITVRVEVPNNTTVKEIAEILKEKDLIKSKNSFYLAARYSFFNKIFGGSDQILNLKSGVYNISSNMSVSEIFKILSSGQQEYIVVSIPEGLTITKIGERLEKSGVCEKNNFVAEAHNPNLLNKFNIPSDSFEGYLFPDTYYFTPDMDAKDVIVQMVTNMKKHISEIPELASLSPDELNKKIILASIVEREYRVAEEAPLIASVFSNRLKINMGLGSCATVEYIITEIENKPHPDVITYNDLKNPSPYNTYKWAGLPPGAISNPGKIAISAAAKPEKTKYLYFKLVDAALGKHKFSTTLEAHNSTFTARTKK